MIKALYDYNEILSNKKDDYPKYRQSRVKVEAAIILTEDGELKDFISLEYDKVDAKGRVYEEKPFKNVPFQKTRSSGICPYFLCDKAEYLLGINPVDGTVKEDYFDASVKLHKDIIGDADGKCAKAIVSFFTKWNPQKAIDNEIIKGYCFKGGLMLFRVDNEDSIEDSLLWDKWAFYFDKGLHKQAMCPIVKKVLPEGGIHPKIKNLMGGSGTGASLISFNQKAFESYGMKNNSNSRMSDYAVFAYTTALNYLLSNNSSKFFISNITFVCWADSADDAYSDFFKSFMENEKITITQEKLELMMKQLQRGIPIEYDESSIDPQSTFYILGMVPNNGRVSVVFYEENSFGKLLDNVAAHYERLKIVGSERILYPKVILKDLLSKEQKEDDLPRWLVSDFLSSIFNNRRYPDSIFIKLISRVMADKNVSIPRISMIKAFLIKNSSNLRIKEVTQMKLNNQSDYQPYVLGRLFAVLEKIQKTANDASTIKDRFFDSACATPSIAFPSAISLANKHMKQIERDKPGCAFYLEKQLEEIMVLITETFPSHLTLEEQGALLIGYYHQINSMNKTKEKEA